MKRTFKDFINHFGRELIAEISFLLNKQRIGVKIIVFNLDMNMVLLVRHCYGNSNLWYLPGGSVKYGERPDIAVERELFEETGLSIQPNLLGIYSTGNRRRKGITFLFYAINKNISIPKIQNKLEVEEVNYFLYDDLPTNLSDGVKDRISEALTLIFKDPNDKNNHLNWGVW